ncbi:hypothetical protein FB446DRAFT_740626 [Lentinula raphanica]|nr:hypothetical protein FB446DRAFT_740626 [Lentinula raphanica]
MMRIIPMCTLLIYYVRYCFLHILLALCSLSLFVLISMDSESPLSRLYVHKLLSDFQSQVLQYASYIAYLILQRSFLVLIAICFYTSFHSGSPMCPVNFGSYCR